MSRVLRQLLPRAALPVNGDQSKRRTFYNLYRRPPTEDPHSRIFHLRNGWKIFRVECGRFVDEWKEKLRNDKARYYPGEIVPQFNFREQEDREAFQIVADGDYNHGFSKGVFSTTEHGTGLFKGFLDTRVPKDGKTKKAGYVILQGLPKHRSFLRQVYLDWVDWTHFVIRCRGDGRQYVINLHMFEEDDLSWHVLYQYPLHTRGGPYWQITKIPFSKFVISYQGFIQDKQCRIDLTKVTKIGIGLMDKTPGPFEMEIDFIACMAAENDPEEFAYETYETPEGYTHAYGY